MASSQGELRLEREINKVNVLVQGRDDGTAAGRVGNEVIDGREI